MGEDLFAKRPDLLGAAADEILGWSLQDLCLDGPEDALTSTDHLQPALYALAYSLWDELSQHLTIEPAAMAGHSLGEYTALAASGAFDFATGLRLVAERGRAMADAAAKEASGMVALLGIEQDAAEALASDRRAQGGSLWVANYNEPRQFVLAGGTQDLEWLESNAPDYGARRVVVLNVAGGFHSPFMEPAVVPLAAALDEVQFVQPTTPVWANLTGRPMEQPKQALLQQVVAPVRFMQIIAGMAGDGITVYVHVGPGNVTATMAKRTAKGAEIHSVSEVAGVEEAAAMLGSLIQ